MPQLRSALSRRAGAYEKGGAYESRCGRKRCCKLVMPSCNEATSQRLSEKEPERSLRLVHGGRECTWTGGRCPDDPILLQADIAMSVTCPACKRPEIPALRVLLASVWSPARCEQCASSITAKPGPLLDWAGAVAQNVLPIAGIVASFRLGSVWPFVIGIATALLVPAIVVACSPLIPVAPTQVTHARRNRWLLIIGFLALVLLTGLLS